MSKKEYSAKFQRNHKWPSMNFPMMGTQNRIEVHIMCSTQTARKPPRPSPSVSHGCVNTLLANPMVHMPNSIGCEMRNCDFHHG